MRIYGSTGQTLQLCRIKYAGYANMWGFAIYRAGHDDYQNSSLPTGYSAGTAEDALVNLSVSPQFPISQLPL